MLAPATVSAHLGLKSSVPARGAQLEQLPSQLRLTFTEPVELSVARIALIRDGRDTIALLPLQADSGGHSVIAGIAGERPAGAYVISWQITGRDGHPVRGTIPFAVLADTPAGSVAPSTLATADSAGVVEQSEPVPADVEAGVMAGGAFAANGAVLTMVRWLGYVSIFVMLGALSALVFVVGALTRRGRGAFAQTLATRCTTAGIVALLVLAGVETARLLMHHRALAGGDPTITVGTVLGSTVWGGAWLVQATAIAGALLGLIVARRGPDIVRFIGLGAVVVSAVAITLGRALGGHAAATAEPLLPVLYDTLHLLAAGTWIGTLALVLFVALPRLQSDAATALIALRSFSTIAVGAVAVVLVSGVLSAWTQLGSVQALTTTPYGQLLIAKLVLVLIVLLLGARNQRKVRDDAGGIDDRVGAISRAGRIELATALAVLAVTAVLVATPTPGSMD